MLGLLLCLLVSAPSGIAAEEQPLAWPAHTDVADWTSTGLVGANIGLSLWKARHSWEEVGCVALRTGITVGAAELTKVTVTRMRPDGSDSHSFYSEHTALAAANWGWNYRVGISFTLGTGYLRMAANKHYWTDVLTGLAAGAAAHRLCGV